MSQSSAARVPAEDMAAIRRVTDEWLRCFLAHDFEALAKCYVEDAVVMPQHHPALRGRDEIKKWMAGFAGLKQLKLEIHEIEAREDLAYVRGSYSMTLQSEGSPGPVDDEGKSLEIRKRQPDGSWPLAIDIFNSDK